MASSEPDWKSLPTSFPFLYSNDPLDGDVLIPLVDSPTPFTIPSYLAPYFDLFLELEPDHFPFLLDSPEPISFSSINTLLSIIDLVHSHQYDSPITITIPRPINTDISHYTLHKYGIPSFLSPILSSIPLEHIPSLLSLAHYLRAPRISLFLFILIAHSYRSMHYLSRMNTLVPPHHSLDPSRTNSQFESMIYALPQIYRRHWIRYL